MATIKKATLEQQVEYMRENPSAPYPLYGFVTISGQTCYIEDLRKSDPDICYEVISPTGFKFANHDLHNLLCHSVADMREQLSGTSLTECERPCTWCGAQ